MKYGVFPCHPKMRDLYHPYGLKTLASNDTCLGYRHFLDECPLTPVAENCADQEEKNRISDMMNINLVPSLVGSNHSISPLVKYFA
jgi:hypothetical protein